jgi:RNA polymerase sigma factor (sigma-70 family)
MNRTIALPAAAVADTERLAATVAAQGPRLRAFVRRQIADLHEIDDIVQESLLELVSAYRLAEPIEHVAAWLRRVARNRIIDRLRQRSRQIGQFDDEGASVVDEWLAPAATGPEEGYVREVLAGELAAALAELPPGQREAFVAHELDGRSFRELAAQTGVAVNTLLGRKHAAVRHLRRRLRDIRSEFEQ